MEATKGPWLLRHKVRILFFAFSRAWQSSAFPMVPSVKTNSLTLYRSILWFSRCLVLWRRSVVTKIQRFLPTRGNSTSSSTHCTKCARCRWYRMLARSRASANSSKSMFWQRYSVKPLSGLFRSFPDDRLFDFLLRAGIVLRHLQNRVSASETTS
jgi:hypothetical protein